MSIASEIVGRIDSIGTVPTSVAQVFGLVNDPKATGVDFERVVRPDVGLTANLLRCANSSFYRGSREITSVREAITRPTSSSSGARLMSSSSPFSKKRSLSGSV